MRRSLQYILIVILTFCTGLIAGEKYQTDNIKTDKGNLEITFIGHGTLMFKFDDKIIHVDPVGKYADYSKMPKADIILVTHHHGDHLDSATIDLLKKPNTLIEMTRKCNEKYPGGNIMKNGDAMETKDGIKVEAVPAYNLVHKREDGQLFHPKGEGNGYIVTFGDKRVYIAGDTENIPVMKYFRRIDIAFLPMNLPYTMTPEMVVNAVNLFNPKILYPYHFGDTNVDELLKLMENNEDTEVRVRHMK